MKGDKQMDKYLKITNKKAKELAKLGLAVNIKVTINSKGKTEYYYTANI